MIFSKQLFIFVSLAKESKDDFILKVSMKFKILMLITWYSPKVNNYPAKLYWNYVIVS